MNREVKVTFEEFASFLVQALELELVIDPQMSTGLWDELELDSMQAFHMIIAIEAHAGLVIPEADVPDLYTLGDAYEYFCRVHAQTTSDSG